MPEPITMFLIGGLIAAGVVAIFWGNIRDIISDWLRNNGLSNSSLMDAWISFHKFRDKVIGSIFTKTKKYGKVKITQEEYDIEDIADERIRDKLKNSGSARENLMEHMN